MQFLQDKWLARASTDTPRILDRPLVSIICFCKDRASVIRRCIDSVLGQSYSNIEFVVQDGASTDGTLEILRGYNDPRIKIVSEKDSGPAEGFWRVLNRCEGDIIGTCLSDEELLPDAVERAVAHFRGAPHLGAITCDGFVTNEAGEVINEFNAGEFNFVDYLFGWYSPFWPGSFFRRQALLEIGLGKPGWTIECLEFETWCRLATLHEVKHVPERMSKYAVHDKQLSQTTQYFHEHFDNRALLIRRMFSKEGFFGENDVFLNACLYNQLYLLYNHVRAYKLADQEKMLAGRMRQIKAAIHLDQRYRYLEYFSFVSEVPMLGAKVAGNEARMLQRINEIWVTVALLIPAAVRQLLPRAFKRLLRSAWTLALFGALNLRYFLKVGLHKARKASAGEPMALPAPEFSARVYHEAAKIYYARGQIEQALALWERASTLNDPTIDGLACQAMLMSPEASYESLLAAQKRWAQRYAQPDPTLPAPRWNGYDGKRKLRIGYHCSFMDSDTIRVIVMAVLHERDRERFEVFGYSPTPTASDVATGFDVFRSTASMPDAEFVRLVREDRIDVLVELTGFSPLHRFAAMASRCAPVQVSYLNHTGTTAVPNVDYVLADAISVLPGEERFFTETVWRLPGCFLSYTYDHIGLAPVSEPPYRRNGHVTFGCFGSGGKINQRVIELWAAIMQRVPDSVFSIRNGQLDSDSDRQFMRQRFERFGIPAERLRILGGTDRNGILKSYDEVDISLDTWPYCGGNTIAEPVCQGVPVVTLKGDRFSGRYGASLMLAAGCPELVASTAGEYVDIAVELARAPERLDQYRSDLRRMAREHGMSDARAFARKLEAAYVEMVERLPSTMARPQVAAARAHG